MGYTRDVFKGISWMSGARFVTRALSFIKTVVLARVLSPQQFGVFGIASLVLSLLETLTETGINIVLIQSKENISEYVSSAWVVSIIRGIAISGIVIISAPFIANFFHSRESLNILLFISLVPFIRGFINPAEVKFQKELEFRKRFFFLTVLFAFDALISVIFALLTHSVYSLVWGMLAGVVLEVILSFVFIKPTPKFEIQRDYFRDIFHKGKWITVYSIFNYIAENGDNAVVGKIIGTNALGFYQMAFKLSILPISEVSDVVNSVVFPVFTRISDDKVRLTRAYFKTTLSVAFFAILIGAIVYTFPTQIILILLGKNWLAIVPVLKILALFGMLRAIIAGPGSALFLALKKQNYVTAMTIARFTGLALTIYPLVKSYGIIGAGYSALISVLFLETPIVIYLAYKSLK